MECTGTKLAGKRFFEVWSVGLIFLFYFISFFSFSPMGFALFFTKKKHKAKIFSRATRANHKTAAFLKIYLLFAQKHRLHLARLILSHFFRSMTKKHKMYSIATRP